MDPATQQGGAAFTTAWSETGTYTVTVNTECGSFSRDVNVFDLDLIVDGVTEEEELNPGKFMVVNSDDDDSDSVIDIDDGYNKDGIPGNEDDANPDEDDLVELTLSIEPELKSGIVTFSAGSINGGEVKFWLSEKKVTELEMTEGSIHWDLSEESMPEKIYVEGCSACKVIMEFYYDYVFDSDWAWLNVCEEFQCPTGETSFPVGNNGTYSLFNARIKPFTISYSGMSVTETVAAPGSDGCHFPLSDYPPWTEIIEGTWFVTSTNYYGPDTIGWNPELVIYYRSKGRAPCNNVFYQAMELKNFDCGVYKQNTLRAYIDPEGQYTVGAERDGVWEWHYWP